MFRSKRKKREKMERKTRNKPNTDQPQLQINSLYQRGTDATTNNRKTNIIIAPTSGGERVVSRQRSFHNFATFVKISKRICKFSMEFKRSGVEFAEISRGPCCETHDATNFPSTLTLSLSLSLRSRNVLHLQLFARPFEYAVTTQSGSARVLAKQ